MNVFSSISYLLNNYIQSMLNLFRITYEHRKCKIFCIYKTFMFLSLFSIPSFIPSFYSWLKKNYNDKSGLIFFFLRRPGELSHFTTTFGFVSGLKNIYVYLKKKKCLCLRIFFLFCSRS